MCVCVRPAKARVSCNFLMIDFESKYQYLTVCDFLQFGTFTDVVALIDNLLDSPNFGEVQLS